MKKIGICACYDTRNYGSMLQAFATQVKIDQLGYESEYIVYRKKKTFLFLLKQIPRLFNSNLMFDKWMRLQKKMKIRKNMGVIENEKIRELAFLRFKDTYYRKFSPVNYGYAELCRNANQYDTVLVGSDQLWTPGGLASNFYNLMFVPDSVKKVSYATSFGVSEIPWYQIRRTRKYLKRFDSLSVREIRGAEIINKIAGRRAEVVCDPTLLLSCDEWRREIPSKRIVEGKYIFCYFLGENPTHRKLAEELQAKTGYKIVTTPFLDSFVEEDLHFGDERLFDIGPDDFVNLIRGAEYVLTDSFHGSVFSIIHHKQFLILDRFMSGKQSRNSRIESLCSLLGLEKRRYSENVVNEIMAVIDYNEVDEKMKVWRTASLDFLVKALK